MDASCGAQEAQAVSLGARSLLALWDWLAGVAGFLPCLITGYWALHMVGRPNLWPLLLALLVGLAWASCKFGISASYRAAFGIGGSTVAVILVTLILVPALANTTMLAKAIASHPLPTDFIKADDAFDVLMARGLEHGFPPPDLSYRGEIVQYHYGLPLLMEFMHRSTGLPPHVTLYGVLPGLFSVLTLLSLHRMLRQLFPNWTINRLLLGVLLSQAVVLIDVYNLVWHVRDFLHGGSLTVLGGMPIAAIYAPPVLTDGYGNAEMGVVLLLILLANVDRSGPFTSGFMLFAIYLTKQQLFLPLAMAWSIFALTAWALERNMRGLGGLGVATALVIVSKVAVPFKAGFALRLAFNDYLIGLGRGPNPLAPALLSFPAAAFLVVSVSALLGMHVYGPALYSIYYRNRSMLLTSGKMIVLLAGTYVLSAITILVGTILVLTPTVQARFDAIYQTIGNQLWLPETNYRVNLLNVSLQVVLAPCGALFSLLATGAILQWQITTSSRKWSGILLVFCILSIGLVGYRWTQLAAWHPPASWHVIGDSEIQALQAAQHPAGTIFTNDLRYRPGDRLGPLLNLAAPQLFGQQFYASNFMYSYAYPDALDRLHSWEWFWSTPVGDHHRSFLMENDIKYLLIRWDVPFPREILSVPWISVVLQNRDYCLLRVSQAYGKRDEVR